MPISQIVTNSIANGAVGATQTATANQFYGFKNRIINGAMQIWQRGTSGFTSTGNYAADRFLVSTGTSLSAVGQSSDVPSGFRFSLSVAGTNVPSARQYIESVNCTDLVGQSVTVSVWIKQSSGAGSNAMYIYLAHANTADTFSGLTQIGSTTNITTTSSWAQYTATFTNLPAGAANGLALIIGSNSAGSSTFLITGVQLEKGSTATSFDYRPYGTELMLCQRYYWKYICTFICNGFNEFTTFFMGTLNLPTQMRTAPTMTTDASASYRIRVTAAVVNVTALNADLASVSSMRLIGTTAGGLTTGQGSILIADAERFLAFSAEL